MPTRRTNRRRRITRAVLPAVGAALTATSLHANVGPKAHERPEAHEAAGVAARDLLDRDARVSHLLGRPIVGPDGRDLGAIQDLVVDTRTTRVAYVVVTAGGIAGIDDRLVEVPIEHVRGGMRDERVVMTLSREELATFRTFERGSWPDWNRVALRAPTEPLGTQPPLAGGEAKRYRRASELLDARLIDPLGESLGNLEDLVVHLGTGRVRYAVADFDPSWLGAGRLVVVPAESLRPDAGDTDDLVLRLDRATLRAAPAFDRATWPDLDDAGFRRDLARTVLRD